ncbi:hypothetical protein KP509_36G016600 [Ceratopteris richardii]|uniref:Uncharacterized protein n=1 Tax=Ceratopteris richardii TaxID=49495 RepID=A0A8T2Q9S6_CERRI|nr:hypothetical protein KP509_36G016600 [Ceratopteris richardii]
MTYSGSSQRCMSALNMTPILCVGFLMFLLAMAGFIGSCWAVRWLLWIYLFVMFVLILTLLAFTTFALAVTSNESNHETLNNPKDVGPSIHQYQLSYYSGWLTQMVQKEKNWKKIESCLKDAGVCASPDLRFLPDFLYRQLNPLQVGCCKPPAVCQYTNVNGSVWEEPLNATASPDCELWSNDPADLCLACSTCKAGLLANLRRDWSKVALVNVSLLAFLLVIYALACCASHDASIKRRSARLPHYHRYHHDHQYERENLKSSPSPLPELPI